VGHQGFHRDWGYKKRYLVKIWVSFNGNMYWEGGSTKRF
jgi:hypothetical protein